MELIGELTRPAGRTAGADRHCRRYHAADGQGDAERILEITVKMQALEDERDELQEAVDRNDQEMKGLHEQIERTYRHHGCH